MVVQIGGVLISLLLWKPAQLGHTTPTNSAQTSFTAMCLNLKKDARAKKWRQNTLVGKQDR
jgi:hypothetical protein